MRLIVAPSARMVERFELITSDGRVYRYPKPSLFSRFATWLWSAAEPAVLSAIVLGLLYFAGSLAESLELLASGTCKHAQRAS